MSEDKLKEYHIEIRELLWSAVGPVGATGVTLWVINTYPPQNPLWRYLAYYGLLPLVWIVALSHWAIRNGLIKWSLFSRKAKGIGVSLASVLVLASSSALFYFRPLSPYNSSDLSSKPDTVQPQVSVQFSGVDEVKDISTAATGMIVLIWNNTKTTIPDFNRIFRFPQIKESVVLGRSSNAKTEITGGGKAGSDYVHIEIHDFLPTQHVDFRLEFVEKQQQSILWLQEYGYEKDTALQLFMGPERKTVPQQASPKD